MSAKVNSPIGVNKEKENREIPNPLGPLGAEHLMLVEFNFDRKDLKAKAGEIKETLEKGLKTRSFPFKFEIKSVTVMSRWLVIVVDFPDIKVRRDKWVDSFWTLRQVLLC